MFEGKKVHCVLGGEPLRAHIDGAKMRGFQSFFSFFILPFFRKLSE